MHTFSFIDSVSEVKTNESLTAFYRLKGSEEFLKDHFAGFPVMPGVLLLETLKQAAARLLSESAHGKEAFFCLTRVDEVKFGQFVKPGSRLKISVRRIEAKGPEDREVSFEGRADLMQDQSLAGRALSAKFSIARI